MLFKILPTVWFHILSICYGSTNLPVSKYVLLFYCYLQSYHVGFPGNATCKEPACQCRRHERQGFNPWIGKVPWRRTWQPTPVVLPGETHGQRSLAGYSPWGSQREWHNWSGLARKELSHKELSSELCDDLEGWDQRGGRLTREGTYVYL